MRTSRVVLPFLLLAFGCRATPVAVYKDGLDRDRFTKVNLRPESGKLRPTAFLTNPERIPAGTPARVILYSETELRILLEGRELEMLPIGAEKFPTAPEAVDAFLDKYFSDTKDGAIVRGLGPAEHDDAVLRGAVGLGMTKEQVYASLGPPYKIDGEKPAIQASRREILASDHWSYPHQWVLVMPDLVELYFGEGLLQRKTP